MVKKTPIHIVIDQALDDRTPEDNSRFTDSPITQLIAAALAAGFRLLEPCGFRITIQATDKGDLRSIEWCIDGSSRATFCSPDPETIHFPEFRHRYESEQWCLAHPDHPIAFQRWTLRASLQLLDNLHRIKPATLLQRGKRQVTIPSGCAKE